MCRGQVHREMKILITCILLTGLAFAVPACAPERKTDDRVGVVVTILPQAEFVEKVGGEKVKVTVMVPPGASPHTHEPTPSQMAVLAEAEMYIKMGSGVEFELVWMDKLLTTNRDMLVVDCSQGIELKEMVAEQQKEHEEESEPHDRMDPHIWMSPMNARIMVENIFNKLIEVDPENMSYYRNNRDIYLQELAELNEEIKGGLAGVVNRRFMVYHPAFGYFANEYNLTMIPIEKEGKEPTAAGLVHLIEQAKAHDIRVIFAEPQFNPKSAEVIAEAIGGKVVLIDPLAKDYTGNLELILNEMLPAMR